ncbi:MAG: class I SAM-dependent methyltransferase [Rhodospirillales bacterium CG15_BIG_FIL_POST_REV_8_21_14_020_66_15]|nr:MAG: class I SAM-dependent methyltransferase [Rhodospirillales bacterium CG15_BIG_FIL_POST_REV_8_21_14_020_66_15]
MDRDDIKAHWRNWANTYGTDLRATTKTSTAKKLELDALTRAFRRAMGPRPQGRVLEIGCGNGANCLHLAAAFPDLRFTGVDFIPEMIEAAATRRADSGLSENRLSLVVGDVLDPSLTLGDAFDLIFTDRCLINLRSDDQICTALTRLSSMLAPGGHLVMIENSTTSYAQQNWAREVLGLPPRTPAAFNHFLDEQVVIPHLEEACGLKVLDIEDFISLHDLVLYALLPALNGGEIDYEHPLVEFATTLNIAASGRTPSSFGMFGQNRLFFCRK